MKSEYYIQNIKSMKETLTENMQAIGKLLARLDDLEKC